MIGVNELMRIVLMIGVLFFFGLLVLVFCVKNKKNGDGKNPEKVKEQHQQKKGGMRNSNAIFFSWESIECVCETLW